MLQNYFKYYLHILGRNKRISNIKTYKTVKIKKKINCLQVQEKKLNCKLQNFRPKKIIVYSKGLTLTIRLNR